MEKIIYNVKEVSNYLKVSESSIRKLVRESKIPYFRLNKKILFDKNFLDDWLYKNQIKSIDYQNDILKIKTHTQEDEEGYYNEMGEYIIRRTRNNH